MEIVNMTEFNLYTRTKMLVIYLNENETMFSYNKTSKTFRIAVCENSFRLIVYKTKVLNTNLFFEKFTEFEFNFPWFFQPNYNLFYKKAWNIVKYLIAFFWTFIFEKNWKNARIILSNIVIFENANGSNSNWIFNFIFCMILNVFL